MSRNKRGFFSCKVWDCDGVADIWIRHWWLLLISKTAKGKRTQSLRTILGNINRHISNHYKCNLSSNSAKFHFGHTLGFRCSVKVHLQPTFSLYVTLYNLVLTFVFLEWRSEERQTHSLIQNYFSFIWTHLACPFLTYYYSFFGTENFVDTMKLFDTIG